MASEYQNIAFFLAEKPPSFDPANPGATAIRMAMEKFGFQAADFNPDHRGRFYGHGKYGYTFEVQVKFLQAQTLAGRNHPDVLNIFE